MSKHGKTSATKHQQCAALPVRLSSEGRIEVLLLTSRGTGRWVIPKGWPIRKLSPSATAAREAYEEAGLEGQIVSETPVGHYHYAKQRDHGPAIRVRVRVLLLSVSRQLAAWPEQAERETCWFDPAEAAELVAEPELSAILRTIPGLELDL